MSALARTVERNHRSIIAAMGGTIAVFLVACTFNGVLPICHYIFGCDHDFHVAAENTVEISQFLQQMEICGSGEVQVAEARSVTII